MRTFAVVASSLLVAACSPSTGAPPPADAGPCDGCAAPAPRDRVVLFGGRHGIGPEGFSGEVLHADLADRYRDLGLTVDYGDEFPDEVDDVALFVSILPGALRDENPDDPFSDGEVDALIAILDGGGNVVIIADHHFAQEHAVVNDLLDRLGSTAEMQGGFGQYVLADDLDDHPLFDGVTKLGTDGPGVMDEGDLDCVARWQPGDCLVAVDEGRAGLLVLLGDSQILDDVYQETFADDGADNDRFADNLLPD